MTHDDLPAFEAMLSALAETYGKRLGTEATKVHWRALSHLSLDSVRWAYESHVRDTERGRFFPLPADVLAQIQRAEASDGRPGADEAWAMMPRSEAETVVWTEEMAEAMNAARPLLAEGDQVAARMAFREAYNRLVSAARLAHRAVQWVPSLGYDASGRVHVLVAAVQANRLSLGHVQQLLSPAQLEQLTMAGRGSEAPPMLPQVVELAARLTERPA